MATDTENAEALAAATDAAMVELQSQADGGFDAPYIWNYYDDPKRQGIDGHVDLPALVRAIVEAWEATPHLPTRGDVE